MELIGFSQIQNHDVNINNIVCLSQCWKTPHRSFSYLTSPRPDNGLIFITGGEAEYSLLDNTKIKVHPSDVLYLPKGSYYLVEFTEEPTTAMLVNFMIYNSHGEEVALSESIIKIATDTTGKLNSLFSELCEVYPKSSNKLAIKSKCFELINAVSMHNSVQDKISAIIPAITYINNHLNSDLRVPQLAHLCAMSESTFRREFANFTGISPKKYINEEKIKKAKQMLLSSEFSINEICSVLGFYDNAHFSRVFKEITGKTPIEYRNKN